MFRKLTLALVVLTALVATSRSASAQLVVGTRTSIAGQAGALYVNLDTLTATPLWGQVNNKRPNGLAADEANGKLYAVDSARLGYWNYGSMGTAPTFISANGGLFRSNGTTNTATGVDGLEFVNGTLYGWTNFGSTVYSDGIYSITTSGTFAGLMTPVWLNDNVYDFEGLAYNPADGQFYGTNTLSSAGQPVGLYKIDALNNASAVPQFVKAFDATLGLSSFDGLAIGGGSAYLTQFVNGTLADNSDDKLVISKYNLATGVYDGAFQLGIPNNTQITSGAAWAPGALVAIPEPATGAVLALMGTIAIARRR